MKKERAGKPTDELRKEYDLSRLKGGVRGKYLPRTSEGTTMVVIEPDLADIFPDSKAVNRALRLLSDAAQSAAARKGRRRRAG